MIEIFEHILIALACPLVLPLLMEEGEQNETD
jgi:hypothetical protein